MTIKPLWTIALLAFLYWEAPRLVPYATKLARYGIACSAALVLPYVLYSAVYGIPRWSADQSMAITVLTILGFTGLFSALICAAVCLFLDAKRRP